MHTCLLWFNILWNEGRGPYRLEDWFIVWPYYLYYSYFPGDANYTKGAFTLKCSKHKLSYEIESGIFKMLQWKYFFKNFINYRFKTFAAFLSTLKNSFNHLFYFLTDDESLPFIVLKASFLAFTMITLTIVCQYTSRLFDQQLRNIKQIL